MKSKLVSCIFYFLLIGCASMEESKLVKSKDSRIVLQFVPMFTQTNFKKDGELISWEGDWIFRRERVGLLDRQLFEVKPDVVVFQDLTYFEFNPSDSEFNLLSAGALADYSWHIYKVGENNLTQESYAYGVAVALPLEVDQMKTVANREKVEFGSDGSLAILTRVNSGEGDLLIVNVHIEKDDLSGSYRGLDKLISKLSKGICPQRIFVTGVLPDDLFSSIGSNTLSKHNLVDVAESFCSNVSECYTESSSNPIRELMIDGGVNSRNVKMFVHSDVSVLASLRNLDKFKKASKDGRKYGLDEIAVSDRYGWLITAKFPGCESK